MVTETDANGFSETRTYDLNGKLKTVTDREGRVREMTYDSLQRLEAEKWKNGSTVIRSFKYSYNFAGQVTQIIERDADVGSGNILTQYDYTYDGLGRVETVTGPFVSGSGPIIVLTYTYYDNGQVKDVTSKINSVDQIVTRYEYDDVGRQSRVTQEQAAGGTLNVDAKRVDMVYNAAGQLDLVTMYNDLAGTQVVATSDYQYNDPVGRLSGIVHTAGSLTPT